MEQVDCQSRIIESLIQTWPQSYQLEVIPHFLQPDVRPHCAKTSSVASLLLVTLLSQVAGH